MNWTSDEAKRFFAEQPPGGADEAPIIIGLLLDVLAAVPEFVADPDLWEEYYECPHCGNPSRWGHVAHCPRQEAVTRAEAYLLHAGKEATRRGTGGPGSEPGGDERPAQV